MYVYASTCLLKFIITTNVIIVKKFIGKNIQQMNMLNFFY